MLKTNRKSYFYSSAAVAALLMIFCGSIIGQLKSVTINFANQTRYPVEIYWINDAEGDYSEKLYNTLKTETEYEQQTYQTHRWSIRYNNTVIGEYVANGATDQNVSILPDVIEAGPIWNQADAENKCWKLPRNGGIWTGAWWTTVEGRMSVCEYIRVSNSLKSVTINFANQTRYPVEIYWINDAEGDYSEKLYNTLKTETEYEQQTYQTHRWSIRYNNTVIADYVANGSPSQKVNILRDVIEAGPIWSQADAENKCRKLPRNGGIWTGAWWTTVEGRMSVCEYIRVGN